MHTLDYEITARVSRTASKIGMYGWLLADLRVDLNFTNPGCPIVFLWGEYWCGAALRIATKCCTQSSDYFNCDLGCH